MPVISHFRSRWLGIAHRMVTQRLPALISILIHKRFFLPFGPLFEQHQNPSAVHLLKPEGTTQIECEGPEVVT